MKTNRGFFAALLLIAAIVALLWTANAFLGATSAIHEVEALIAGLIVTVAIAAGYIGSVLDAGFNRVAPPAAAPQKQQGQ